MIEVSGSSRTSDGSVASGVFAAMVSLRAQSVALAGRGDAGHPAIGDGFARPPGLNGDLIFLAPSSFPRLFKSVLSIGEQTSSSCQNSTAC